MMPSATPCTLRIVIICAMVATCMVLQIGCTLGRILSDACLTPECTTNADCDDAFFCNGLETCDECVCVAGTASCQDGEFCNEATAACDECHADEDTVCDDRLDCTADTCVDGRCVSTPDNAICPEDAPVCVSGEFSEVLAGEAIDCRGCCSPCRSQCELCGPACGEQDISDFAPFDAARDDLVARAAEWICDWEFPFAATGECHDGRLFLYETQGFVIQTNFYDQETRAFIGLATLTDCYDFLCFGEGYWPSPIECAGGTVTEVFCGTLVSVGDVLLSP